MKSTANIKTKDRKLITSVFRALAPDRPNDVVYAYDYGFYDEPNMTLYIRNKYGEEIKMLSRDLVLETLETMYNLIANVTTNDIKNSEDIGENQ